MGVFKRKSAKDCPGWEDIPGVEIEIVARGEGIVYREAGREYHFNISCARHPLILYVGSYGNGVFPATLKRLTEDERGRLIPRLVAYMGSKGEPVEVRDE